MRAHRLRERFCGFSRGISPTSVCRSNCVAFSVKFADGAFSGGALAFANRAFVVRGDRADASPDVATNITPIIPKSPSARKRATNFMECLAEKRRAADWVHPMNFVRHKFRRYRRTSRDAVGDSLRSIKNVVQRHKATADASRSAAQQGTCCVLGSFRGYGADVADLLSDDLA